MNLNCIITAQEPDAIGMLSHYIKKIPGMKLMTKCSNIMETMMALNRFQVDVLFLNTPPSELDKVEVSPALKKVPMLVYLSDLPAKTTDNNQTQPIDTLPSKVSFDRFLMTVDKLFGKKSMETGEKLPANSNPDDITRTYFFVKAGQGFEKIEFSKIYYVEGYENYIKIVCEHKTILSLNTMKNAESLLSPRGFVRIHRSFIINMSKVDSIQDQAFIINGKVLSVGKSYKKSIQQLVKSLTS